MKVCLIGQIHGPKDEGMKNANGHLYDNLAKLCDISIVDPSQCYSLVGWRKIKAFQPEIIHYLHGPTIQSFILCRLLRFAFPKAKVFLLASNPLLSRCWDRVLPAFTPHHVFSVTKKFHERLCRVGISSQIVYPGVDQDIFKPVERQAKMQIRKELGLPVDKKIVLHVGHCTQARGVMLLGLLQRRLSPDVHLVIVGSSTNSPKNPIVSKLRTEGVQVVLNFVDRIEMLYQSADVYVFPGIRSDSAIDIPLTIFEAMAVNLPVITTRHGGLPDIFEPAPWFQYVDSLDSMLETVKSVLNDGYPEPATRQMVTPYTWVEYAGTILKAYKRLVRQEFIS